MDDKEHTTDHPTDRGPSLNTDEPAKRIFHDAVELPPEQRRAYLDAHCGGDAELRHAVDSLLKAHDEAGEFFASPTSAPPPDESAVGQRVGRYKLLQKIGEGGFGSVYMAEQEHPVRRRVALKIIKLGMDTKAVIARFEAERQALAMMDHPNIARVFDAGATDTGRPYFVMELVNGVPLTTYCDANRLTTRERLELFVPICQAVQHAHQKGIIHRDLKPTNVLVTLNDGRATPKVIDFGIAKATQARLTEKTLFTEFRQMIGTPQYMSPEQAEMSELGVDTRSDLYSLGVLLYELLTGTTPLDGKELCSKAFGEMQRIIREDDPQIPSMRLSTMGQMLPTVTAQRRTDARQLGRLLRGDLDWIVMKCLEKDRSRRYESASGLANDVLHYLADEPVSAAKPSVTYRMRKFVHRYRLQVAAAMVVLVSLIAGIAATTAGLVRALRAEHVVRQQNDTLAAERDRVVKAEAIAQEQKARAEAETRRTQIQYADSLINNGDALTTAGEFRGAYGRYDKAAAELKSLGNPMGRLDLSLVRLYRSSPPPLWTADVPGANTRTWAIIERRNEIIVGCDDGKFRVFDLLTGELLRTFGESAGAANINVANSPDGPEVIVGGLNFVRVIDPVSGAILRKVDDDRAMRGCAISPDGSLSASVDQAGSIVFWETATFKRLGEGSQGNPISGVAFSHDGKMVVTVCTATPIVLWDPRTAHDFRRFSSGQGSYERGSNRVTFSADDKQIICGQTPGILAVFDLEGTKLTDWRAHDGVITSLLATPDGNRILCAGMDGRTRSFQAQTYAPRLTWVDSEASAATVAYVDNTGLKRSAAAIGAGALVQGVAITLNANGKMHAWPQTSTVGDTDNLIAGLTFSPDGLLLAGTRTDNGNDADLNAAQQAAPEGHKDVRDGDVRDVATGRILRRSRHEGWGYAYAISPDGQFLYQGRGAVLEALNLSTGQCVWSIKISASTIDLSSDGTLLASGGAGDAAYVWDARTGAPLRVLHGNGGGVSVVAFAPDAAESTASNASTQPSLQGRRLLVGAASSGLLTDWDLGTEARPHRITLPGYARSIKYSSDRKVIAIATAGHSVALLDSKTLRQVGSLGPVPSDIPNLAFIDAGDGPNQWGISSGANDLRIWDLAKSEEGLVLHHELPFGTTGMASSPDGSIIADGQGTGLIDLTLPRRYRELGHEPTHVALARWYAQWGEWAWTRELLSRERAAGRDVPALLDARANWACGDMEHARRAFGLAVARHEAPAWYAAMCMSVDDKPVMLTSRAPAPPPAIRPPTTAPLPDGVLDAGEVASLKEKIGQEVTAEGVIANSLWSNTGKVLRLSFVGNDHTTGLLAVVFVAKRQAFDAAFDGDAASAFSGARLRVRGKLTAYGGFTASLNGRPEMVLEEPSQVTIVDALVQQAAPAEVREAEDLFNRATASASTGRYDEAVALFSKAIELKPDNAVAWRERGRIYMRLGDPKKGIIDETKANGLDPKDDIAWSYRGEGNREIDQFAKMAEDYSQAIELNPSRQWYWHERAYAYGMLKENEKAIADHTRTIELGDADPGERLRRGQCYAALGNLAKAEEDYSRAIELNPNDSEAWWARGRLYLRMGRPDKAKADLANGVSHCSNNPDDQNALAWELATDPDPQVRDPKAAVELAEKAVAAKPDAGGIWNTLGVAQYRDGNWQAAVISLKKSVELQHGGDPSDWFFLAMACQRLGQTQEAHQWYLRAEQWMNDHSTPADNSASSDEMHRFRAEAEALLGPPATSKPSTPTTQARPE